ncbi:TIGR01777 family oxidoreductase [Aliikangiella sp. IMCC44653]
MSNFLITGGTGLIGSQLTQALITQAENIYVLTRNASRAQNHFKLILNEAKPNEAKLNEATLSKLKFVESFAAIPKTLQFLAIINLAGEPIADKAWSKKQKVRLRSSRIDLTKQLVEWIKSLSVPPKVLLSGSAVGWYGSQGNSPLTEASLAKFNQVGDEFSHQLCEDWETEAKAARLLGIRVCLLRTGLVLSKNGGVLAKMLLPFKLGLGSRLGDGKQFMPWIHLQDYINAVVFLINQNNQQTSISAPLEGVFNLTAPNPVTNLEFSQTLASQLNRPLIFSAPAWLLKILLGERAGLLIGGQKALPSRLTELGFNYEFSHLKNALKSLLN